MVRSRCTDTVAALAKLQVAAIGAFSVRNSYKNCSYGGPRLIRVGACNACNAYSEISVELETDLLGQRFSNFTADGRLSRLSIRLARRATRILHRLYMLLLRL